MQITIGKLLSLLVAVGYLVAVLLIGHGFSLLFIVTCITLLLPLALIWFPDELGSLRGYVGRGGNIDTDSPPFLVSFMGWFILVAMPGVYYFVTR